MKYGDLFYVLQEELHQKIELMGGEASKTLTDQVTHLVAGEVGRKKYLVISKPLQKFRK